MDQLGVGGRVDEVGHRLEGALAIVLVYENVVRGRVALRVGLDLGHVKGDAFVPQSFGVWHQLPNGGIRHQGTPVREVDARTGRRLGCRTLGRVGDLAVLVLPPLHEEGATVRAVNDLGSKLLFALGADAIVQHEG